MWVESMHSPREVILCYHKSTPCLVSERKWNTKRDKGIYDAYIVDTVAGKRHVLGRSSVEQQKNQAHSLIHC